MAIDYNTMICKKGGVPFWHFTFFVENWMYL